MCAHSPTTPVLPTLLVVLLLATPQRAAALPLGDVVATFLGAGGSCNDNAALPFRAARFDLDASLWVVSGPAPLQLSAADVCMPYPRVVADPMTNRVWQLVGTCANVTIVVSWVLISGTSPPAYLGACDLDGVAAPAGQPLAVAGADARVFAGGPLLVNATTRALLGLTVPASAAARTARTVEALPSCTLTTVSRLAGDAVFAPLGRGRRIQLALDGSMDEPPLLLYMSPTNDCRNPVEKPTVNVTAYEPASGAVLWTAVNVSDGFKPYEDDAAPCTPGGFMGDFFNVFNRRIVASGFYQVVRSGYAFGAGAIARAGMTAFSVLGQFNIAPWGNGLPAQLWTDNATAESPLRIVQVFSWDDDPPCFNTTHWDRLVSITSFAPPTLDAARLPAPAVAAAAQVTLAACPLPAPAVCGAFAYGHGRPAV